MIELESEVVSSLTDSAVYDDNWMEGAFIRSIAATGRNKIKWTREELAHLHARIHDEQSTEAEQTTAKHELACTALRYMVNIASTYRKRTTHHIRPVDLFSLGYLGLFQAAEKYDPEKGLFTTYATSWIHKFLRLEFLHNGRTVYIPVRNSEDVSDYTQARNELTKIFSRSPTLGEMAKHLGIGIDKVDETRRLVGNTSSIDMPAYHEEGSGEVDTILSSMCDEAVASPEDLCTESERRALVWTHLLSLEPLERNVLRMRFGFDDEEPMALREIAENLGVCGETVRKIEKKAQEKLRRKLGGDSAAFF